MWLKDTEAGGALIEEPFTGSWEWGVGSDLERRVAEG